MEKLLATEICSAVGRKQACNLVCCFVWVRDLVYQNIIIQAGSVQEQGAEVDVKSLRRWK
jgi:hypothetical protein